METIKSTQSNYVSDVFIFYIIIGINYFDFFRNYLEKS